MKNSTSRSISTKKNTQKKINRLKKGYKQRPILKKFLADLKSSEQDSLFKLAATRGHLLTIDILEKLDGDKYSRVKAAEIAAQRRIKPALRKYLLHGTTTKEKLAELLQGDEKAFYDELIKEINNNTELLKKICGENTNVIESCIQNSFNENPEKMQSYVKQLQPKTVIENLKETSSYIKSSVSEEDVF